MNKHILVVSQYYYPENFRINDITKEWVIRGYIVTVITGIPNYPKGRFFKGYGYFRKRKEVFNGVNIIRLPILPRFNNSIFLALNYLSFVISGWLWAHFTRLKADLVFNFEVSPMTQALPAIWYAKRKRIPSFVYIQDLWPENLQVVGGIKSQYVLKKVCKMVDFIYRNTNIILVTSDSFKKSIVERGIDDEKVITWHQYAEDFYKPIKTTYRKQTDLLKIVFTGNIGEAQGLEILPRVALCLKTIGYNNKVKFTLVGNGRNKNKIITEVKKQGVDSMFEFTDAVPANMIPVILSQSDVAFLSFQDNDLFKKTIPAKLQSYLSCGMPILAIANGESKRIIEDARCGLVSDPNDVDAATKNIIDLFNMDTKQIEAMSKNSVDYSMKYFDKSQLMDQIEKIFMEVRNV